MDGSQFQEEGFNDWEQIQSPSLHTTPPTNVELDMVVIRDNYFQDGVSIFPSSNHEGLQVTSQDVQVPAEPNSPPPPSSSSSYSSSSSNILPMENSIRRRLRLHLEILRSGIVGIAAKLRYCAVCRGRFWSFASVTGVVVAMFLSFLYARVWRWRQRLQQEKNNNRLVLLIKEKDQKINHLLHQIAQLNELLSARRRVPIVRVSQLIIHDRST